MQKLYVQLSNSVGITYQPLHSTLIINHLSCIIPYSFLRSSASFLVFHLLCPLYSEISTFFPSINATFSHSYFVIISTLSLERHATWLQIFMFSHYSCYVHLSAILFGSNHACLSSFILCTLSDLYYFALTLS